MWITKAEPADKAAIHALWKEHFAFDDDGYTDFYFQECYDEAEGYLLKDGGKIISCLQVRRHELSLEGRIYPYAFIVGVITVKEQRRQGRMRELLSAILNQLREPLVLIQGYRPEIYYPFGFEPLYRQRHAVLTPQNKNFADYRITEGFSAKNMLTLYQQYTLPLTGYRIRDLAYYLRRERLLEAMDRRTLLLSKAGTPEGYLIYKEGRRNEIEELIYRDEQAGWALLGHFGKADKETVVPLRSGETRLNDLIDHEDKETLTLVRTGRELREIIKEKAGELYFNEDE